MVVENQQSLQMPATVPHAVPARQQPLSSTSFVPSHGRQPPVTATQVVQPVVPLPSSYGVASQHRPPVVGGPPQNVPEVQKPPVVAQSVAKVPTSATIVAATTATATSVSKTSASATAHQSAADVSGKANVAQEQASAKKAAAAPTAAAPTMSAAPSKPWTQFTGPGKKDPILAIWATVRQVNSGHIFRLAVSSNSAKQPLASPKLIDLVLEGIRTPAVARSEKGDAVN
ncbi:hypothetical protein RFI_07757 [Reticulomyxa filosa]|uniref:Uncharacterized protein n=1 Tax=Reticulomyxa filosa TaxID=46433 RepID=X6NSU7_RETFI|nr:hypothetical protein RFI_07757 [Reticulomyxa filosa]|eukprot:ETO29360.1 hypothetical protein RFI_07757 [Reticulomyxa filosa]